MFSLERPPMDLGEFRGIYQTRAILHKVSILSWNPTAAQLVRVVDEALDLTMAQNMGLPVHFMATSGDTNKHLATGGAATYYDVRMVLVGAMYTCVRFLAIALPWTKAGGESVSSGGGETLAVAIPLNTYMGEVMRELTSVGVSTSGGGFQVMGKYVVGNMSCATKGPYVFAGRDPDKAVAGGTPKSLAMVGSRGVLYPKGPSTITVHNIGRKVMIWGSLQG